MVSLTDERRRLRYGLGRPWPGREYFKQITAEQLVTKIVKGYRRHEWQKMGERNKALDCRVYARAAATVRLLRGPYLPGW